MPSSCSQCARPAAARLACGHAGRSTWGTSTRVGARVLACESRASPCGDAVAAREYDSLKFRGCLQSFAGQVLIASQKRPAGPPCTCSTCCPAMANHRPCTKVLARNRVIGTRVWSHELGRGATLSQAAEPTSCACERVRDRGGRERKAGAVVTADA
jgi:hypothetical protein